MNKLKNLNQIFGEDDSSLDVEDDKLIKEINIDLLADYHKGNIGVKRYNDEDMKDLTNSIKEHGVIQPLTVRPLSDGKYEIILGHHRKEGARKAGFHTVPCIVKEMDDNESESLFIDSNIQQGFEKLSHSERAELIYRRNEALKAQGKRTDLMSEDEKKEVENASAKEEFHLSASSIKRYLRIYQLSDEIKKLLDNAQIAIRTAVNLSYTSYEEQIRIYNLIAENNITLSENQSLELKENSRLGNLTDEFIKQILLENQNESTKVGTSNKGKAYKIKPIIFKKYFSLDQNEKEIDKIIEEALKKYFKEQ